MGRSNSYLFSFLFIPFFFYYRFIYSGDLVPIAALYKYILSIVIAFLSFNLLVIIIIDFMNISSVSLSLSLVDSTRTK